MPQDINYELPWSIRHISAIQIRNLTPFPLRDTVTSTLSRPPTHTRSTSIDDLDLDISKKRGRKYSDSTGYSKPGTSQRSSSRFSTTSRKSTIRPARRRTSSFELPSSSQSYLATPDHTQFALEKVITSRLVETFLTVTVVDPPISSPTSPRNKLLHNDVKKLGMGAISAPPSPRIKSNFKMGPSAINQNGRSSSLRNAVTPPRSPKLNGVSLSQSDSQSQPGPSSLSPDYISPIQAPSTNPKYMCDSTTGSSFASWTDSTAQTFKVELWGNFSDNRTSFHSRKGKEIIRSEDGHDQWRVLDHWHMDFETVRPVTHEVQENFPCNTLVIHHSSGLASYVPSSSSRNATQLSEKHSPLSPHVHNLGYNSDPEHEIPPTPIASSDETPSSNPPRSRRRNRKRPPDGGQTSAVSPGVPVSPDPDGLAVSASWSDLFKLVSLQSSITDYKSSLRDVVSSIDGLIDFNPIPSLERELSERTLGLSTLRSTREGVSQETEELRQSIATRRAQLVERRATLSTAWTLPQDLSEGEHLVLSEQERLASLRARFPRIRTSLFSTLLTIHPIELLSPPDLLYTILSVPLPIPLTSRDPAPPPTIPKVTLDGDNVGKFEAEYILSLKAVYDEDKIATALGYAAHVVQLLAAYLGKGLVYPITYVGSRTLIRDGISAMVGPRMFPLFSKGVDTYRYEYGVFLLNKDLELLMSDRDLRAMDIRHTLPNLKNLLLTLTSGEAVKSRRTSLLSLGSASGLASPTSTPSISSEEEDDLEHSRSDMRSGSATPTSSDSSDKGLPPASFLGMPSFSSGFGFLKRASSGSTMKIYNNRTSDTESEDDEEGNEEDRMTLRAVDAVVSPSPNGHVPDATLREEKCGSQPSLVVDPRTSAAS